MTITQKRNRHHLASNLRRRAFTLIEMLIVITILALFSGVIAINVAKALREQQFNTEVGLVVERLRFAQNIMLVLNRDVKFKVYKAAKEEGLEVKLEVEGGVSKEWQFAIDRSAIILKTIHSFLFDDLLNFPISPGEVEIRFLSGGAVMSRGVIHLSTHENLKEPGARNSAIILYGYPHPIQSVPEEDRPVELGDEDHDYDIRLTNYTVEEIQQYEAIQKSKPKPTQQPPPENPPTNPPDIQTPPPPP